MTTCPKVPTTVMNTVLVRYREKGTQLCPMVTNRSLKLSKVTWEGNTRGGKRNSSSRGLRDEAMEKISGKAMASAMTLRRMYTPRSPQKLRLGLRRLGLTSLTSITKP